MQNNDLMRRARGFSLAEALVVMAIISIFFAAASKIVTTKPKLKPQENIHGYFECFNNGGGLIQRYVRDGIAAEESTVSECSFEPPVGVSFFNINSPNHSSFQPLINNNLTINVSGVISESTYYDYDEYRYKTRLNGSNSKVTIKNDSEQTVLLNNSTGDDFVNYLTIMYPNSKIYNNGHPKNGVIISW